MTLSQAFHTRKDIRSFLIWRSKLEKRSGTLSSLTISPSSLGCRWTHTSSKPVSSNFLRMTPQPLRLSARWISRHGFIRQDYHQSPSSIRQWWMTVMHSLRSGVIRAVSSRMPRTSRVGLRIRSSSILTVSKNSHRR